MLFCSECGKTEEQLGPYLSFFTVYNKKLLCVECFKIVKGDEELMKDKGGAIAPPDSS